MNTMIRKRWIYLYTALLLLTAIAFEWTAPQIASAESVVQPRLQAQVQAWVKELSGQPSFSSWQDASYQIDALGPGTHGWMVSLSANGKPVGYMIVHATMDGGYRLMEYGSGSYTIFSPSLLRFSLEAQGIAAGQVQTERLYVNPLLAVWKITTTKGKVYYADAALGELLPIDNSTWAKAIQLYTGSNSESALALAASSAPPVNTNSLKIEAVRNNAAFDPFANMSWLTSTPLAVGQQSQLTALLDKQKKLDYTVEPYGKLVLYVWPAIGYHRWSGKQLFLAFGQESGSIRYIPQTIIATTGHYYLSA